MPKKKEKKSSGAKKRFDFLSLLQYSEAVAGLAIDEESLAISDSGAVQEEKTLPTDVVRRSGVGDVSALRDDLRALKQAVPGFRSVILSLPPEQVWMTTLEFPGYLSKDSLEEAIRLHLEFALPFSSDDVYIDWELLDDDEDVFVHKLVLGAAKKDFVDAFTGAAKAAGFSSVAVEPHLLSIERAARGPGKEGVLYAIVYPSGVHLGAFIGPRFRFQRFIPWERMIASGAKSKKSPQQALVREIEKVIEFLRSEKTDAAEINRVAAVCTREFFSALSTAAKDRIPLQKEPIEDGGKTGSRAMLVAEGAGLRGALPRREDDLMSLSAIGTEAVYEWSRAVSFSSFFMKLCVGLGLGFVVFHAALYFFLFRLETQASPPENRETASVQDVSRLQSEADKFNDQVLKLASLAARNPEWGKAIATAVGLANPGITLTGLAVDKPSEGMVISGIAKNRDALLQLKATAESSGVFKSVEIPFTFLIAKGEIPFRFDLRFADAGFLAGKD